MTAPRRDSRRTLPSVERVLRHPALESAAVAAPRALLVEAVRAELEAARAALRAGTRGNGRGSGAGAPDLTQLAERAARRALDDSRPQLRRVLNATGIVLHTNLGRAPLAAAAAARLAEVAAGYSSLEFDLATGKRGDRGAGVERWLCRLTGAEAAAVTNNGAAAILLALSALAMGRAVVVSRGELVEIGGSFRVPEILEKSGARLVEVGATNRTHLRDYERALEREKDVAAILRVHPSNFRVSGFTARPALEELAKLARRRKVLLIEDLGSGALVDLGAFGLAPEPTVTATLAAGADVVTCSGDKLLGGAQAGLVLGRKAPMARIRRDPMARALRADKLALAALEATLPLYADPASAAREIPVLAMLAATEPELRAKAERLEHALKARLPELTTAIVASEGEAGGGSLPDVKLKGFAVAIEHPRLTAAALEQRARAAEPPVIGTLRANRFRLDPRTLAETEIEEAARALQNSIAATGHRG